MHTYLSEKSPISALWELSLTMSSELYYVKTVKFAPFCSAPFFHSLLLLVFNSVHHLLLLLPCSVHHFLLLLPLLLLPLLLSFPSQHLGRPHPFQAIRIHDSASRQHPRQTVLLDPSHPRLHVSQLAPKLRVFRDQLICLLFQTLLAQLAILPASLRGHIVQIPAATPFQVGHFLFGQIAVGCDIDMVGVLGGGAGSQTDSRGTRNTRCDWSIDRNRWTAPATALGRRRPKHIISRLKLSNNILNQGFGSG